MIYSRKRRAEALFVEHGWKITCLVIYSSARASERAPQTYSMCELTWPDECFLYNMASASDFLYIKKINFNLKLKLRQLSKLAVFYEYSLFARNIDACRAQKWKFEFKILLSKLKRFNSSAANKQFQKRNHCSAKWLNRKPLDQSAYLISHRTASMGITLENWRAGPFASDCRVNGGDLWVNARDFQMGIFIFSLIVSSNQWTSSSFCTAFQCPKTSSLTANTPNYCVWTWVND